MGAWAVDAFGNDDACDWAADLIQFNDLSLIEDTLANALVPGDDDLEAPDASEAIAAAETIARLQGHFGEKTAYTEDLDRWVAKIKITPSASLAQKAHTVIDRVLTPTSELYALWQDSDDFESWKASVLNIKSRIHL